MREYRSERKNMIAESDSETEELKIKSCCSGRNGNGSRELYCKIYSYNGEKILEKSIRNGLIVIK